jgi:putative membrane protein
MHKRLFRALALAGLCASNFTLVSVYAADAPTKTDQTFMTKAAGGGIYEVEVSKMAASKVKSAEVKAYAEMLVKDHTAANNELKQLASSKGVVLPTDMPADKKTMLDKLSKAKDIDREFVKQVGLDDHKTDIALFEKASKEAQDAEVKSWFGKTLPKLKDHRADAEKLSRDDKASMKH